MAKDNSIDRFNALKQKKSSLKRKIDIEEAKLKDETEKLYEVIGEGIDDDKIDGLIETLENENNELKEKIEKKLSEIESELEKYESE